MFHLLPAKLKPSSHLVSTLLLPCIYITYTQTVVAADSLVIKEAAANSRCTYNLSHDITSSGAVQNISAHRLMSPHAWHKNWAAFGKRSRIYVCIKCLMLLCYQSIQSVKWTSRLHIILCSWDIKLLSEDSLYISLSIDFTWKLRILSKWYTKCRHWNALWTSVSINVTSHC